MTFEGFSVGAAIPHMADQMAKQTSAIVEALNDLRVQIKPMADTWTGAGADAWQQVQDVWDKAIQDMEGRFGKAHKTLNLSYDNYRGTDLNIKAKFGGV
ncbi:WXG100 family type VII secretion target [Amycolatopsis samaneae]|uniref:ESAT-6-like protein n=1 Tax=Amycolatopsis samaneae TaxID=664691 RepID=A0ABW5GDN9_9PSEU